MQYNLLTGIVIVSLCALPFPKQSQNVSTPTQSPDQPNTQTINLLGATIFISYIIAALILTFTIVSSLIQRYNVLARTTGLTSQTNRHLLIFSSLALTSFVMLSYNMLSFLTTSYARWAETAITVNPWKARGAANIIDFAELEKTPPLSFPWLQEHYPIVIHIWQWTTHSTLFLDFARGLCEDGLAYGITVDALLVTMYSSLFMSGQGQTSSVPNLLSFFAIAQILPISFAQNLFFVALILSTPVLGPSRTTSTTTASSANQGSTAHLQQQKSSSRRIRSTFLFLLLPCYRLLLSYLPSLSSDPTRFMTYVLLTRVLLFVPYLIDFTPTNSIAVPQTQTETASPKAETTTPKSATPSAASPPPKTLTTSASFKSTKSTARTTTPQPPPPPQSSPKPPSNDTPLSLTTPTAPTDFFTNTLITLTLLLIFRALLIARNFSSAQGRDENGKRLDDGEAALELIKELFEGNKAVMALGVDLGVWVLSVLGWFCLRHTQ